MIICSQRVVLWRFSSNISFINKGLRLFFYSSTSIISKRRFCWCMVPEFFFYNSASANTVKWIQRSANFFKQNKNSLDRYFQQKVPNQTERKSKIFKTLQHQQTLRKHAVFQAWLIKVHAILLTTLHLPHHYQISSRKINNLYGKRSTKTLFWKSNNHSIPTCHGLLWRH